MDEKSGRTFWHFNTHWCLSGLECGTAWCLLRQQPPTTVCKSGVCITGMAVFATKTCVIVVHRTCWTSCPYLLRHEAPCAHRRCCEFEAVLRSSRRRLRWRYAGIDGCEVATCVAACLNHRPLTCQWSSLGTSMSASEWCKHDCKRSHRRSHSWHKRMGCRRDLRREALNTSSPTALNWLLQLRLMQFFVLSQQESPSVIFRFSRMTIS